MVRKINPFKRRCVIHNCQAKISGRCTGKFIKTAIGQKDCKFCVLDREESLKHTARVSTIPHAKSESLTARQTGTQTGGRTMNDERHQAVVSRWQRRVVFGVVDAKA